MPLATAAVELAATAVALASLLPVARQEPLVVPKRPTATPRGRSTSAAAAAVFENQDLVACILAHANLDPFEFVAATRVSKAWHAACHADDTLMLAAARKPDFLTKRTLMGLFALHWHEADKLPRGMRARRHTWHCPRSP